MSTPAASPNLADLSIVIPVYGALEETLDCVTSLLQSDAGGCPIFLMDDGSDWHVQDTLRSRFADAPNVTLISHFRNRGYTRNIAMGVDQTSTDYVCILNSDTLLPAVWAGPLVAKLESDAYLAGVGPLSNAASFQSVPDLVDPETGKFSENDGLGFDPAERETVAALLRELGKGVCVDVPILNGFCTVFRRSALDAIGGFDTQGYPEGYGEENDLCIRLKAEGYRLCVLLDCFVHHQKSKSFGSARKETLSARGARTLAKKFGPELVPSLSKQMGASLPLNNIRALVKAALDTGTTPQVEGIAPDAGAVSLPAAGGTQTCLALQGGGTYCISATGLSATPNAGDLPGITVSATPDALHVSLPESSALTLVGGAPVHSALRALSQASLLQTLYVTGWEIPAGPPAAETDEDSDTAPVVPWPEAWAMPEDTDKLSFSRLWLSN